MRGIITDQSGASVPSASISINGPSGTRETTANTNGVYVVNGLAPGEYTVDASAPQLNLPEPRKITLGTGVQTLNLQLRVAATTQEVTVNDAPAATVGTDPTANASAVVLGGKDLAALADDPEDLAADLQALAGPSAGPNGGQIFVDGFSGGEIPPKESAKCFGNGTLDSGAGKRIKTMKVTMWPIDRVRPYARNARKMSPQAIDKVAASLREFGWRQPIVVDKDGTIIVGHVRYGGGAGIGLGTILVILLLVYFLGGFTALRS